MMAVAWPLEATVEIAEDLEDGEEEEAVVEDAETGIEHNHIPKDQPMAKNGIPPARKYHLNLAVVAALVIA